MPSQAHGSICNNMPIPGVEVEVEAEETHAIEVRQQFENRVIEHQDGDQSGRTAEAGGSDSLVQGGQVQVGEAQAGSPALKWDRPLHVIGFDHIGPKFNKKKPSPPYDGK